MERVPSRRCAEFEVDYVGAASHSQGKEGSVSATISEETRNILCWSRREVLDERGIRPRYSRDRSSVQSIPMDDGHIGRECCRVYCGEQCQPGEGEHGGRTS